MNDKHNKVLDTVVTPLNISHKTTNRGFTKFEITDSYSVNGSIQESSNVTPHIWLGTNTDRLHLTVDMTKELIQYLQYFVDNNSLPNKILTDEL